MTAAEFRQRLKYAIEHPKCKRCGKELYIPEPPKNCRKNGAYSHGRLSSSNTPSITVGMNLKILTKILSAPIAYATMTNRTPSCSTATRGG